MKTSRSSAQIRASRPEAALRCPTNTSSLYRQGTLPVNLPQIEERLRELIVASPRHRI